MLLRAQRLSSFDKPVNGLLSTSSSRRWLLLPLFMAANKAVLLGHQEAILDSQHVHPFEGIRCAIEVVPFAGCTSRACLGR